MLQEKVSACTHFRPGNSNTAGDRQSGLIKSQSPLLKSSAHNMLHDWQNQLKQHQCSAQTLLDGWQQKLDEMAQQLDAF